MAEQAPAEMTTIEVRLDGPYRESGPCLSRDSRSEGLPARATFLLCRCGNSSNTAYCNGTHDAAR